MKVLFVSNIPSPYRVDFFNELGKYIDLTVLFEARRAKGISFDWNDSYSNFEAKFLSDGYIQEQKFNFEILKEIKKRKYDIIFMTNYYYKTELLAYLKLIFCRTPFVLEIDGGIVKKESRFLYALKRFLLTKPKYYFSPSKSSDNFLLHYGADITKIHRYEFTSLWNREILGRVVDDTGKTGFKEALKLKKVPLILCVARIIPLKGIDVLVEALNRINDEYQCLIIGEHSDEAYYSFVKAKLNKKTKILSFKNKQELSQYYMAADIFVLPTYSDVWGLVINEAMSKGLPTITTTGCVAGKELIRDGYNGYLTSPGERTLLKSALESLIKDSEKRTVFGENALKTIRKYTIENMAKNHKEFLKNLLYIK